MLYDGQSSQFFRDQNVIKEDLNNIEYTKIKMLRDSVQAGTATPGVCAADSSAPFLLVTNPGPTLISVAPGTAIDYYGRLIVVPDTISVSGSILTDPNYHPAWPARVNITAPVLNGIRYYVHLGYAYQEGIPGTDDTGALFNSRRYDSYNIYVDQSISSSFGDLTLAEYVGNGSAVTSLTDIRQFYATLGSTQFAVENGIADDPPPNYGDPTAYTQGSLGLAVNNYTVPSIFGRATISPITSFMSLNGKKVTGPLFINFVDWSSLDGAGNYIIYIDEFKAINRTTTPGDLSILTNTTVLPLFRVNWNGTTTLSFVEDLRKWDIALTRVGGAQFVSGSLILNEREAGQTHQTNASLYFIDTDHKLSYDKPTNLFSLSDPINNLSVSGSNTSQTLSLATAKNIAIGETGGNSVIYFSDRSANLTLNSSSNLFLFSNGLTVSSGNFIVSSGTITASGNITTSGGNIVVSSGNIGVSAGNITVNGIISVTGAGIDVVTGNVDVDTGDVNVTAGDVNVGAGDVNITAGNVKVGGINLLDHTQFATITVDTGLATGAPGTNIVSISLPAGKYLITYACHLFILVGGHNHYSATLYLYDGAATVDYSVSSTSGNSDMSDNNFSRLVTNSVFYTAVAPTTITLRGYNVTTTETSEMYVNGSIATQETTVLYAIWLGN